jgi:hypothetical protein
MHYTEISSTISLAVLLFVAGCAHTVRFKAVDTTTGKPLAGVDTSWRQDSYDLLFGAYHFGPTNLPPSGKDGVIAANGIYKKKVNLFIFSRSGYSTVYGGYYLGGILTRYSAGCFEQADHTNSIALRRGFIIEEPLTRVSPTNGFIIVRMRSE